MFMNYAFKPVNEVQQKMVQIINETQPDYVTIVEKDIERDDKWPQDWCGHIIIHNQQTNKYFYFDFMGNDNDGVTDFLSSNFKEVGAKNVTENKVIYE